MNDLDLVSLGKIVTIREKLIEAQERGERVYRFESGDPSFDIPDQVKNGIKKALDSNLTHYVPIGGIPTLRQEIANCSLTDVTKEDVFVTNGAMNALYVVYKALHNTNSNNRIAVPDPMWTEAVENIRLASMEPVEISFDPHKEIYNLTTILKRNKKKLDGIFINSPHNPTGRVIPKKDIEEIIKYCVDKNIWIISDEAYEGVTYTNIHECVSEMIPKNYDKWISIHSMSKTFSMSGLRTGWIITKNKKLQSRIMKALRCTINGVNSATQHGAIEALKMDKLTDRYFSKMMVELHNRRNIMFDNLDKCKDVITPLFPRGGFFIWCKVNNKYDADDLSEKLASMGIGNAPGSCFGDSLNTRQSLRFSFSVDTKQVEEGTEKIVQILNDPEFIKTIKIRDEFHKA